MNRRVEIIRILNNCLIIYSVFVVFMMGFETPLRGGFLLGSLLLVLAYLMSELMQAFFTNLILFLMGHVAVTALTAVLIHKAMEEALCGLAIAGVSLANVSTVVSVLFMIVVTVLGIYTRVDSKGRFYPEIYEGALFVLLFIYCRIAKVGSAEVFVLFAEMFWAILAVIFYNARQTIAALVTYHEGDFVPYEQIRKNNGVMLKISLGITVILMFLCSLLDYGKELLAALRSVIVSFLTWLFSHFDFEVPESEEIQSADAPAGGMQGLLPNDYVDDSIWHKIWDVLFWVVAVAVTILFIFVLVKLIREFYKLFNSSGKGIRDRLSRDKREFLNPLSDKDEGALERRSSRLKFIDRLTRRGNIRRMFTKYVQSGRGFSDIRPGFSPSQIESTSLQKEAVAYELYEKARYSSLEISPEDVDEMRKMVSMRTSNSR